MDVGDAGDVVEGECLVDGVSFSSLFFEHMQLLS